MNIKVVRGNPTPGGAGRRTGGGPRPRRGGGSHAARRAQAAGRVVGPVPHRRTPPASAGPGDLGPYLLARLKVR